MKNAHKKKNVKNANGYHCALDSPGSTLSGFAKIMTKTVRKRLVIENSIGNGVVHGFTRQF